MLHWEWDGILWFASLEHGSALAHGSGELFLPWLWKLALEAVAAAAWGEVVLV